MSLDLTPERTLELLRRAVAEKGADHVYPRAKRYGKCLYREPDGSPSCIVGHVLIWAGVDPAQLVEGFSAWRQMKTLGVTDERVRLALDAAQMNQDRGATWGAVLAAAERVLS